MATMPMYLAGRSNSLHNHVACSSQQPFKPFCQVQVYSGRGSGQVWTKADEGRGQRAGQEIIPAGVGDRLDSMTKDNER